MLNRMKRFMAILLSALLLLGAMPMDALAAEIMSGWTTLNGTRAAATVMPSGVRYTDDTATTRTVTMYPGQSIAGDYNKLMGVVKGTEVPVSMGNSNIVDFKRDPGVFSYVTFTAKQVGTTTATATYRGQTHRTTFDVIAPEKPNKITIRGNETEMAVGSEGRVWADYEYSIEYDPDYVFQYDRATTWTSSNSNYLEVTSDGTLKAKSVPGGSNGVNVRITAKATSDSSITASVIIRVVNKDKLTGIEVYGEPNIKVGRKNVPYTVQPIPSTATAPAVNWESSNTSVATISRSSGELTAKAKGTTTITATSKTDPNITASFDVTVHEAITEVKITGDAMVVVGKTLQLTGTVNPSGTNVEWSVREGGEEKEIVSVSPEGMVKGLKAGTATIVLTAQDGSYAYAEHEVVVVGGMTSATVPLSYRHTTKICGSEDIKIPSDGTEVKASSLVPQRTRHTKKANDDYSAATGDYEFTGVVRVGTETSARDSATFGSNPQIDALRYSENSVQYRKAGTNTWKELKNNEKVLFYYELIVPYNNNNGTNEFAIGDISVRIADWYGVGSTYENAYNKGTQKLNVYIYDVTKGEGSRATLLGSKLDMHYWHTLVYRNLSFGLDGTAYEVVRLELDGVNMGKTSQLKYFSMSEDRTVTLYVRLKPFIVYYHADDSGVDQTTVPAKYEKYWNQNAPVAKTPVPVREGYNFVGWRGVVNGQGNLYQPGSSFTMPAHDVHLYAEWQEIKEGVQYIPVVKNGNDVILDAAYAGTVSVSSEAIDYWTSTKGSTATAKENWDFVGWYSDAACTDEDEVDTDAAFNPNVNAQTKKFGIYYALFTPELTSVSGTKTWKAPEGTAFPDITINLLRNSQKIDAKKLTNGTPSYSFANLPKVDVTNGNPYTYTVTEEPVQGYNSVQNGNNFTNTITGTIDVSGTKTWVDGGKTHNNATEITLTLKRTSATVTTAQTVTNAVVQWTGNNYRFTGLDKYDSEGNLYTYTVEETQIPADYISAKDGNNFTNTITGTIDVSGTKTWVDGNKTHNNATEITLTLTRTSAKAGSVSEAVTATPTWTDNTYKYAGLPKYDNEGYEYTYVVTEAPVEGYISAKDGNNFTNTITGTIDVSGTKTWVDGNKTHDNATEITLTLTRISAKAGSASETVTATPTWTGNTYKYADLPKYDTEGYEYTYDVTEAKVADYDEPVKSGLNFTNTISQKNVDVKVTKTWSEATPITHPTITFRLLRDNREIAHVELANGTLTHTFENLPKYAVGEIDGYNGDLDGHEFVYTVTEDAIHGYEQGEITGSVAEGFAVTNTRQDTSVKVEKVWAEGSDSEGKSIVVRLHDQNGEVGYVTLDASNEWKHEFTNLPTYIVVGEETVNTEAEYTVTEDGVPGYRSVVTGDAVNGFTVTNYPSKPSKDYTAELYDFIVDGEEGQQKVRIGDEITYTIEWENYTNAEANVTITDTLDAHLDFVSAENDGAYDAETRTVTWTIEKAAKHATGSVSFKAIVARGVTEGDEAIENTASVIINEYEQETNTTVLPLAEAGLTLEKEVVEPKAEYALGDMVKYKVTITNTGNVDLLDVKLADTLGAVSEWDELPAGAVATENGAMIASLKAGTSMVFTYSYKVTHKDILVGKVENVATVTAEDPTDPDDPFELTDTEIVETEEVKVNLDVEKAETNRPTTEGWDGYKPGDTVSYSITVTNNSNVELINVKVVDELIGWETTIASMLPGASQTFTEDLVVTVEEADALAGKIINKAVATADPVTKPDDPDNPIVPMDEDSVEVPTDFFVELDLVKEAISTPADEKSYTVGETITYRLTLTNKSNVTVKNVVVTDELTGGSWQVGDMKPGAVWVQETSYEVTEADVLKGDVVNTANAVGETIPDPKNPDEPWEPKDEDKEEVQTSFEPKLEVVKTATSTPADEKGYVIGEEITYEITVSNTGDVTLYNVVVEDDLTGASWKIAELIAGASETFKTAYVTQEKDVLAGSVLNVATAKAAPVEDPYDPENPWTPETKDEEEVPTDFTPSLEVVKTATSTPRHERGYQVGETITYNITVSNTGNVSLKNVVVEDSLTGDSWTFELLGIGESTTVTTRYITTRRDVDAGHVLNVATAKADPIPDPKNPDKPWIPEGEDDEDIPTRPIYRLTVRYWYERVGGERANPTFTREYYYGEGYNVASPHIPGYTVDIQRVKGVITGNVEYNVIYRPVEYNLTVYYIFQDGSAAFPTYRDTLKQGDEYHVSSPTLEGYSVSRKLVAGVMPGRDLVYTVIYVPTDDAIIIDEYGVPLGLGDVEMNVGDCFE